MNNQFLRGLNPSQKEAVEHGDGPLLVLAGAGTGKTRVVTVRIAHLVANGVNPENILAVTFTNKAAREMKQRVGKLVGSKVGKLLTVTTFHSFSIQLLRRFGEKLGYKKGFGIATEEDRQTLLRSILRENGISTKVVAPRWGIYQISAWKNEGLTADEALEVACDDAEIHLAHAFQLLSKELKRRQVMDFDDMLLLGRTLLKDHPDVVDSCRDRFRYLMVDEYQDTNSVQYDFVRLLAGGRRNLAVVGDDDQSIYGWRGARAGNILDFGKHYPGAKVVTLDQNYRSTNVILRAANRIIGNNQGRMEKNLWSALGEGRPVELYRADDERDELRHLISRIRSLKNREATYESMAILFRANTQSNAIELFLREATIPYRVVGTRSLFDRRECRDLIAYLKVIANPMDDGALLRIINTPSRGIGKTTQDKIMATAVESRKGTLEVILDGAVEENFPTKTAAALASFRLIMSSTKEYFDRGELAGGMEHLLKEVSYQDYLNIDADNPQDALIRWNVLTQLVEMAGEFEKSKSKEDMLGSYLESLALDDRPKNESKDEKLGVTMLTVHAAKGLEYDHVFLTGLEEGLLPHKNSFGDDDTLDTIDEERRLFYVALTRARKELYLSLAKTRRRFGRDEEREESRFLGELGEEDIHMIDPATEGPAEVKVASDYLSQLKGLFGSES
ncbi:MAG: superfamily I DNA/RNA helicase [Planctomycetota bacterium]|jgi:superfamily I DNA/RNA helicase